MTPEQYTRVAEHEPPAATAKQSPNAKAAPEQAETPLPEPRPHFKNDRRQHGPKRGHGRHVGNHRRTLADEVNHVRHDVATHHASKAEIEHLQHRLHVKATGHFDKRTGNAAKHALHNLKAGHGAADHAVRHHGHNAPLPPPRPQDSAAGIAPAAAASHGNNYVGGVVAVAAGVAEGAVRGVASGVSTAANTVKERFIQGLNMGR